MSVSSHHPDYSASIERWELLRDSYSGERTVKAKGTLYLPPTASMLEDGMGVSTQSSTTAFYTVNSRTIGAAAYAAYNLRAVFYNYVEIAVKTSLGILHRKPPVIKLPPALEPLRDRATVEGDGMDLLLMKINEEQLITGRLGLMLDLPLQGTIAADIPYIAMYSTERIINWDDGAPSDPVLQNLNLVVLDEKHHERDGGDGADFTWTEKQRYRVLILGDPDKNEQIGRGKYSVELVDSDGTAVDVEAGATEPSLRGKTLDEIPFVFINPMDLLVTPDKPPLETLGNLGMTIYRSEADYRQQLFMQGQDTLVITGEPADDEKPIRTGANASIQLTSELADAKYIGVESKGLEEVRTALENDKGFAEQLTGQFIEKEGGPESGEALRRRMSGKNVTLVDIAIAGAAGLEKILKIAAVWVGANPDDVEVTPNLDFTDDELTPTELAQWMTAKQLGAPISTQTIWENIRRRELTNFETMEKEIAQIVKEQELLVDVIDMGPEGDPGDEDEDNNDDDNTGDLNDE